MLVTLLKKFETYDETCSVTEPKSGCVTFVREPKYLKYLENIDKDMWIIVPKDTYTSENLSKKLKFHYSEYPEFEFTIYHNELYEDKTPRDPIIGDNCKIHKTVIMDVDGLKVVNTPSGEKIHFIHTGIVCIGDDVHIGAYTVIHRGTLGTTTIENGCKIGAICNIGHNCSIGLNNIMAVGVIFNGGVHTGYNCWFGSGSLIKHKVTIIDNVIVGMGAVVTKDIKKSGVYVGNPSKFLKPIEGGWNF